MRNTRNKRLPAVGLLAAPSIPAALIVFFGLRAPPSAPLLLTCAVILPVAAALLIVLDTTGKRIALGVLIGALLVLTGGARLGNPRNSFYSTLPASQIQQIRGTLIDDLRAGAGPYRRIVINAETVTNRSGWSGSAGGQLVVIWQGEETLRTTDRRVLPVRGDRITVSGLSGVDDPNLWTRNELLYLEQGPPLTRFRRQARTFVRGRLVRLDQVSGPLVLALLLGERADLPEELSLAVRRSGAAHALALSGMHLGVLAGLVSMLLRPFAARSLLGVLILPVLGFYVWVAGWIPSLLRALILVSAAAVFRAVGRRLPVPLLLAHTVVITAVVNPALTGEVGFRLSILALVGIVVLGPPLVDLLSRLLWRPAATYLAVTLAAMVATAPLSLSLFGVVYPAGLLLAGVLSFLVVLQMWSGLLFIAVARIPLAGTLVARFVSLNARAIAGVAGLGRFFPVLTVDGAKRVLVVVIAAAVVGWWWKGRHTPADDHTQPQLDF